MLEIDTLIRSFPPSRLYLAFVPAMKKGHLLDREDTLKSTIICLKTIIEGNLEIQYELWSKVYEGSEE